MGLQNMNNETIAIRNDLHQLTLLFQDFNVDKELKFNKKTVNQLIHVFSSIPDFRKKGMVEYKLENIIGICLILALKGEFTSFYHIAMYVRIKHTYFEKLGLIEKNKIPSHDTFRRFFMNINANKLRDSILNKFYQFMNKIVDAKKGKKMISGDGKKFNGSGRKNSINNVNVFNIYDVSNGICLSSVPLDDKESEIKEFQRMLPKYNLSNVVVTADALHCQKETSQIIIDGLGEYVFCVKDNQRLQKEYIEQSFNNHKEAIHTEQYCDYDLSFIHPGVNNIIGSDWPGEKTYIKVISYKRKMHKNNVPEVKYYISSSNDINLIKEAINNRWNIENGLHLFKDTYLKEDECTFMDKNSIKVMATLNNIVYGFYRIASAMLNESMAETKIRYKDDPTKLIATVMPLLNKDTLPYEIKQKMRGLKNS